MKITKQDQLKITGLTSVALFTSLFILKNMFVVFPALGNAEYNFFTFGFVAAMTIAVAQTSYMFYSLRSQRV